MPTAPVQTSHPSAHCHRLYGADALVGHARLLRRNHEGADAGQAFDDVTRVGQDAFAWHDRIGVGSVHAGTGSGWLVGWLAP